MVEFFKKSGWLLAIFFLVAFAGGASKALLYRKTGTRALDILAQGFASGVTGFVAGSVCLQWLGTGYLNLVMALSGLAGWLGPSLMDYMAGIMLAVFQQKFGKGDGPEQK